MRLKVDDIDAAFGEVISLDLYRILSRLRSRHAKSIKIAGKRALVEHLHDALHDRSIKATTAIMRNGREAEIYKAYLLDLRA